MPRSLLLLELFVLFVALPLAYRFAPFRIPALPVLWVVAIYAWWQLTIDSTFNRSLWWNATPLASHAVAILALFAVVALALWIGVRLFVPQLQWSLIRKSPGSWALVMLLYPILSVYPQGILYRAFFLHRYASLFPATPIGNWELLLASAAAFGFMHIVFRNPLAVLLTFFGGILFAWRYQQTSSLLVAGLEHSLYGCWLFTVGLGQYFYHGVWPKIEMK
jgi:membrane protease YdiL (CAAX protease family)